MTITVDAGTLQQNSSSGTQTIAVTIPADAEFVYVLVTGYHGDNTASDKFFDKLNWDNHAASGGAGTGNDFTFIGNNAWSGSDFQCEAWYMDDTDPNWPGAGSKTLYWSCWASGTPSEGYNIYVGAMTGVDTSGDPIVDVHIGPKGAVLTSGDPLTLSLTGVGADDVAVMLSYAYQDGLDPAPSGYGQTSLADAGPYNLAGIGVAYKAGASSMRVETASSPVALAFAVKAAAGGGSSGNPSTIERATALRIRAVR